MLRFNNLTPGQGSAYLTADNYYTQEQGLWYGKGAEALGLTGEVTTAQFQSLEQGLNPATGEKIVSIRDRAGMDATFSAPKSVSIAYELADADTRVAIRTAHESAVKSALYEIQAYAQARVQTNGNRQAVTTGNIAAAMFTHDTNRELEPQIHTHTVIFNLTQTQDGKFAALHNDSIVGNQYYFDQIYQNELAANLQKIGFQTQSEKVKNAVNHSVKISGITAEQEEAFSKRTAQVQAALPELAKKYPNATKKELLEMAALGSRKSKVKEIDRDEVRAQNQDFASKIGLKFDTFKPSADHISQSHTANLSAAQALDLAITQKTQNEALFSKEDISREALQLGLQHGITLDDIKQAWTKKDDLVLTTQNDPKNRQLFTTAEMQKIEAELIKKALSGKNTQAPLLAADPKNTIHAYTAKNNIKLTDGQAQAMETILSSTDRVTLIQGDAGTGKTFMVQTAKNIALNANKNIEFIGLAPTGKAADGLESESGIKSQTLDSFFTSKEAQTASAQSVQRVYIVDESGMIGTKKMNDLLKIAEAQDAKVVLIGDRKQFKAVEAGDAFGKLQDAGLKTAEMSEVLRQKTDHLKSAVKSIKAGDTAAALKTLGDHISAGEFETQKHQIASEYLNSDPAQSTLIIASTNAQAQELNTIIRSKLVESGTLAEGEAVTILQKKDPSGIQKHLAASYSPGDTMEIQRAEGFQTGAKLQIQSVDTQTNTLTFTNGQKLDLNQKFNASLFSSQKIQVAENEKIIFLKNDKSLNVKNGQIATVKSIKGGKIEADIDGRTVTFSQNQYQKFAHAYAVTDYKSQGMTVNKIIIAAKSASANLNSFYVQLTRAKFEAKIFIDDLQKFSKNIQSAQEKTAALNADEIDTYIKKQGDNYERLHEPSGRSHFISSYGEISSSCRRTIQTISSNIRALSASARAAIIERLEQMRNRESGEYREALKTHTSTKTLQHPKKELDDVALREVQTVQKQREKTR